MLIVQGTSFFVLRGLFDAMKRFREILVENNDDPPCLEEVLP